MNSKGVYRSLQPYLIVGLAGFFYIYEFYLRVMPSAITHELMLSFSIDASGLGLISSLFYFGYAPMQIPAGLLFDRFSPRVILTISVFFCSAGALLFGMTDSFALACVARYIIGFSSSFAFVGSLILASRWFEAKYYAMIAGIIQFMGSFGAMAGEAPIAKIVEIFGWRPTAIWSALGGIFLAVLFALIIRNQPPETLNDVKNSQHLSSYHNECTRLKRVLGEPQTWAVALYAFSCWAPISIFAAMWGVPFLTKLYQTSAATASTAVMATWLGTAVASPFVGWWSNRINNRRLPLILCSIASLITSVLMIYIPISWPMMTLVLFLFGCAAGSQTLTFGLVQDIHPPAVAGTAVGFNNMAVILGGMTLLPLVGLILKSHWSGALIHGLPDYQISNYQTALIMVPICAGIGIFSSVLLIKETHCTAQYEL